MFFSQEKRPKIKSENSGATVGEVSKILGSAWRVMSDDQKAPYEAKAKEDRERYEEEMAKLRQGSQVKKGRKAKKQVVVEDEEEDEEEEEEEDEEEEEEDDSSSD